MSQNIIQSNFIGKFKTGDNINLNFFILEGLYKSYDEYEKLKHSKDEYNIFIKPITIEILFILEAVIWDFIWRIQHFTVEGVAGINSKTLADIKRKKITDFRKCLEQIS